MPDICSPFYFVLDKNNPDNSGGYEKLFRSALTQAQFCMGSTHPNPPVGAVLVKNNKLISLGYTHPAGDIHAEIAALNNFQNNTQEKISGSELFVTLEPCGHVGRTPPCTRALINAQIARVIYGVKDPNPQVSGQGILALEKAGISCEQIKNSKLLSRSRELITPFKKYITQNKPYIILKIATSRDFKFSRSQNIRTQITQEKTNKIIHKLRRAVDAILVGGNTLRVDNPKLSARLDGGLHNTQPQKIILSRSLNFDPNLQIFNNNNPVWLFCAQKTDNQKNRKLITPNLKIIFLEKNTGSEIYEEIFAHLANLGITSLLIEPGPNLFTELVKYQVVDEIWHCENNKIFGPSALGAKEKAVEYWKDNYVKNYTTNIGSDLISIWHKL